MLENNTFRYELRLNGKIIQRGWTYDLNRREAEIVTRFPGAIIKQVGRKVTWEEAGLWLKRKGSK